MKLLALVGVGIVILSGFLVVQSRTVFSLDKPFLFTYGSWDKLATIEGGVARIKGTPKGGGGLRVDPGVDLSSMKNLSPQLVVKVAPGNKMRAIRLLVIDSKENMGSFSFLLPASGEATLTPELGASFGFPGVMDKGTELDLSKIVQWQLAGDWSSEAVIDLEVMAIRATEPTAAILAERAERLKVIEAERLKKLEEARSLRERFEKRTPLSPKIVRSYFLGDRMLALEIVSGEVKRGSLSKYMKQEGDKLEIKEFKSPILVRQGREVGYLLGPKRDQLVSMESYAGDPLLDEFANNPATYRLSSEDDSRFASGVTVRSVSRKTKPIDASMPSYEMVLRHRIYLTLEQPLTVGKKYRLSVGRLNTQQENIDFVYAPEKTWTEAIKVNQIGFRPDDPVKRAFMSLWLGSKGAHTFTVDQFSLVDAKTGKKVFSGPIELRLAPDAKEKLHFREENFSKTAIYRMDFASFKTPGIYKILVDGVGVSDPFPISNSVWDSAFKTQMRGLFNNRSGMELGPPFTNFRKPRDMHPADGTSVTLSKYTSLDGPTEGPGAEKADTGVKAPQAWGGYHDAGDWNPRRVSHLEVTYAHLELMKMFPSKFAGMKWNIPKSTKAPDTLNEALWELECFRRLQRADGGIPYGIESNGDPYEGEVSWLQSMKLYVFAPDPVSSWKYVPSAILFSKLIEPYEPKLAKLYRASATKAMEYAERELPKFRSKMDWRARDSRNLAAANMFAVTKDAKWNKVFLETTAIEGDSPQLYIWTVHWQGDAAFVYASLPSGQGDPEIKRLALIGIENAAKSALRYAAGNAWNLTSSDPGKPMINGFFSSPHGVDLVRAHHLTKKREYLEGAVQSCLFSGGANPSMVTYTSGLGVRSAMPFKIDYRLTGQKPPEGLTIYGNADIVAFGGSFHTWPIQWHISRVAIPNAYEWPIPEMLFETFLYPGTLEYTVDAWAPNVYVWGYLAARK